LRVRSGDESRRSNSAAISDRGIDLSVVVHTRDSGARKSPATTILFAIPCATIGFLCHTSNLERGKNANIYKKKKEYEYRGV
jgi:hypothetical protein